MSLYRRCVVLLFLWVAIISKVLCLMERSAMFSSRRQGVAQAFRNNQQLQQFVLTDVTATEKVLGTGSYGSVVEV